MQLPSTTSRGGLRARPARGARAPGPRGRRPSPPQRAACRADRRAQRRDDHGATRPAHAVNARRSRIARPSSPESSETSAARSTLPALRQRQPRHVEPQPGQEGPGSCSRAARAGALARSAALGQRDREHRPQARVRHRRRPRSPPRGRRVAARASTSAGSTVAVPTWTASARPATVRTPSWSDPAVAHGREAVGVRPGAGRAVRRTRSQRYGDRTQISPTRTSTSTPGERRAGRRRASPTRRTTARRRRSSGAPAPRHARPRRAGPGRAGRRRRRRRARRGRQSRCVEPGRASSTAWRGVAGGVDQRRAEHRGVHGCEQVHGGRRAGPAPRPATSASSPVSRSTAANDATHDSVVRTTERGPAVVPAVVSATGSPASCAARNAATGSSADVTGRGRSDSCRLHLAAGSRRAARVGRVHAARDDRREHRLDQVAGRGTSRSSTTACQTPMSSTTTMPTIPNA